MIKPVWKSMKDIKPKKSGLYLFKVQQCAFMAYYHKSLDYIMEIDCGEYLVGSPTQITSGLFWTDMPRINKSEILSKGYSRIAL